MDWGAEGARSVSFDRYASWYDAFNGNKNYDAEAAYLLGKAGRQPGSGWRWLDIGCGTGHHLAALQSKDVDVEGVDRSAAMIERARRLHPAIPFHIASAQGFDLAGSRDVVSMLFHVMSYQISDAQVSGALERVQAHLAPRGAFLFDFWHSEAVVRDPPVRRVRQAEVDGRTLFRISRPREDRHLRRIDVQYEFRWDSPAGPLVHEELHRLRHFTAPELSSFLADAGMSIVTCEGWMSDRPLACDDWYGFICARPRERG